MDKHFKNIDRQIESNQGKNIFLEKGGLTLRFIEGTINAISNIKELSLDSENILIDYATDKSLEEFCRINQYYTFNSQAKKELRNIYSELFSNLKTSKESAEIISKNHFQKLKQWLRKTNPFAEKIYSDAELDIEPIACSEYSADLQIGILKIDPNKLMEPVLDIGCGKQGNMVNYLNKLHIDTYGIDRFSFSDDKLINADWLEFNYGIEKWGTILSNLGFSNHFKHHNLREDGNYIEYGNKYMKILKSLKIGGRFHYTPDLTFIEHYLNPKQYRVEQNEMRGYDFKMTIITRLE